MHKKMKVEIWSDIMCPFCYIGKRKFESALAQFPDKENIEIEWKSFQLSPDVKTTPGKNINEFLAEHKGISVAQAKQLNDQVTHMAAKVGLTYRFDISVVANTFNAHRFLHFAKDHGKQNEAEELLFRSYFTDGKNIDDQSTLLELGGQLGLNPADLQSVLASDKYSDAVRADITEAHKIGVRGVPFFVFDRKYAVSGAQDVEVFLETIEKSFQEWRTANTDIQLKITEGQTCKPDGSCD